MISNIYSDVANLVVPLNLQRYISIVICLKDLCQLNENIIVQLFSFSGNLLKYCKGIRFVFYLNQPYCIGLGPLRRSNKKIYVINRMDHCCYLLQTIQTGQTLSKS